MTSRHVRASVFRVLLKLLFFSVGVGSESARVAVATTGRGSLLLIFLALFGQEDHLNNILKESNGERTKWNA